MERSAENCKFIVKSAERTIKLIELIASAANPLTFTEIKNILKIPKSSLSYLLEDLENYGYIARNPVTLRYSKGIRLMEYCILCMNNTNALNEINLELEKLGQGKNVAVHAGTLDGRFITYISKFGGQSRIHLTSDIGLRAPAHSTALGRVLLAEKSDEEIISLLGNVALEKVTPFTLTALDKLLAEIKIIRKQKYAVEIQQSVLNAACIAVPVYDSYTHNAVFAISITVPATQLTTQYQEELVSSLRESSRCISIKSSTY